MNKSVIVGIVIVAVIGGGYLILNKSSIYKTPTVSTSSSASTNANVKVAATIIYSRNGFSPSLTTVKSGDVVAITNNSTVELQLDSDPHPVHTDDSDLNVGTITPNETKTFKVTNKGSFGFHNHLNSSDTGKIIIE